MSPETQHWGHLSHLHTIPSSQKGPGTRQVLDKLRLRITQFGVTYQSLRNEHALIQWFQVLGFYYYFFPHKEIKIVTNIQGCCLQFQKKKKKSTNVSNNKESFIIFKIQRKTVQLLKRNIHEPRDFHDISKWKMCDLKSCALYGRFCYHMICTQSHMN